MEIRIPPVAPPRRLLLVALCARNDGTHLSLGTYEAGSSGFTVSRVQLLFSSVTTLEPTLSKRLLAENCVLGRRDGSAVKDQSHNQNYYCVLNRTRWYVRSISARETEAGRFL